MMTSDQKILGGGRQALMSLIMVDVTEKASSGPYRPIMRTMSILPEGKDIKQKLNKKGLGLAQLVKCFPSMYKALDLSPTTAENWVWWQLHVILKLRM